jgi:hypothetical protein
VGIPVGELKFSVGLGSAVGITVDVGLVVAVGVGIGVLDATAPT